MSVDAKGLAGIQADDPTLDAIRQSVEEKVNDFEHLLETPFGDPTAEAYEDYDVGWSECVMSNGSSVVATLPLADREHAGRIIPVKNLHATGSVTVRPSGDDTIDGDTGDVYVAPGEALGYFCQGDGAWVELWRQAASGWTLSVVGPKTSAYTAKFGEMVLCDMTAAWTLTMPSISSADIGKIVVVKVYSDSQALMVSAGTGQSHIETDGVIMGNSPSNWHGRIYVAISTTKWAIAADYKHEVML